MHYALKRFRYGGGPFSYTVQTVFRKKRRRERLDETNFIG